MKIYVLNLRGSEDRRRNMERQLNRLGLDYEIFEATEGARLSDEELEQLCTREAIDGLSKGMLGAAITHHLVHKRTAEEGHAAALILEDDVQLADDLAEVLQAIDEDLAENEVILLHYMCFETLRLDGQSVRPLGNSYRSYEPLSLEGLNSGAGYIISSGAARGLAESLLPVACEPDAWRVFSGLGAFASIRCVYPTPVNPAGFKSTIAATAQSSFRRNITGLIDRWQIPFVSRMFRDYRMKSVAERSRVEIVADNYEG